MKTKSLKIYELYSLKSEIEVIITYNLKGVFKMDLGELYDKISKIIKKSDEIRMELINKYLKDEMATGKKAEECEGFKSFSEEMEPILQQERTIKYHEIKREYLEFDTDKYFPILFSLFREELPEEEVEEIVKTEN